MEGIWYTYITEKTVLGVTAYAYHCSCGHIEPKHLDSKSANLRRAKKHADTHEEEI